MALSSCRHLRRLNVDRFRRRDDGLDFLAYRQVFQFLRAGDKRRVFKALELGFDVTKVDRFGFSTLHRACTNHLPDVATALIAHGARLEAQGTDEWRPLHVAAISNALGCPTVLVNAGAMRDVPDKRGNTPLHLASYVGLVDMVRELLDLGFSKTVRNAAGETPHDRASDRQRPELQALLA